MTKIPTDITVAQAIDRLERMFEFSEYLKTSCPEWQRIKAGLVAQPTQPEATDSERQAALEELDSIGIALIETPVVIIAAGHVGEGDTFLENHYHTVKGALQQPKRGPNLAKVRDALKSARQTAYNVVQLSVMGTTSFQQAARCREYIDTATAILDAAPAQDAATMQNAIEQWGHDNGYVFVISQIQDLASRIAQSRQLQARIMCTFCNGSGESPNTLNDHAPCENCNGEGYKAQPQAVAEIPYLSDAITYCESNPLTMWGDHNDNNGKLPAPGETVLQAACAYLALVSAKIPAAT